MIVVLTPDVKEARGLLGAFSRSGSVAQDATLGVLPCFVLPDLDMLVAVGGNGKAQFAAQTQYVLDRCPETEYGTRGLSGECRIGHGERRAAARGVALRGPGAGFNYLMRVARN